jgi:tripartite-type tricarboxylate transporter receptor subunit TctC
MDRIVFSATLAAGLALAATIAAAQQYPTRPVKMIVPFSPGSGVDVPARIAAEKLSQALGQSFVVENRTGAGGTIASAFVASAAPDGYTLLVNSSAHTLYPSLYNSLSFDPAKDLVPVVTIAEVPLLMVVSPEKGWRSLKDLVAYAKANPGALTYGSAGVATTTHVSFERLRASAQFTGVHVPFKGTPEAITEVIAGRIDVTYTTVFAATPGIRSNKLVPIALAGRKHSALLPDVPTSVEAGFPDSDYTVWVGILAPAQTPRPIMARLSDEMMKALATAETGERIAKAGLEPLALPIEQFQAATRAEFASNQVLVKAAGIKPQ